MRREEEETEEEEAEEEEEESLNLLHLLHLHLNISPPGRKVARAFLSNKTILFTFAAHAHWGKYIKLLKR